MRRLFVMFALVASLILSAAPAAMAQDDVDIDAVADTVQEADVDALITAMETPMSDEDLPDGFSNATWLDPESADSAQGTIPTEDLEGAEGSVAYMLDWAAADESGTPEASAMMIRMASVNYVMVDEEITDDDMQEFKEGAEEGIASEDEGTSSVEEIEFNGQDAVLLTYVIEEEGVSSVVKMIAVPVGNTMVMSMTVMAAESVDEDEVQTAAEDLLLASIAHLGEAAEGAQ